MSLLVPCLAPPHSLHGITKEVKPEMRTLMQRRNNYAARNIFAYAEMFRAEHLR